MDLELILKIELLLPDKSTPNLCTIERTAGPAYTSPRFGWRTRSLALFLLGFVLELVIVSLPLRLAGSQAYHLYASSKLNHPQAAVFRNWLFHRNW